MRREDRAIVKTSDILAILDKCDIMRLGLCIDNMPYIVPMHYAYESREDKLYIYFHCASQGRKLDIIAKNNRVCFEADRLIRTIKQEKACDWSAEYESVIGEGCVEILQDASEKAAALELIMARYGFEGAPIFSEGNLSAVTVLRVKVECISGKRAVDSTP